jgi:DNA polymerase III sliding clamp (beta) subunit (PCNA family)
MKPTKIDGKLLLAAIDLVGAGFSATTLTRVTMSAGDDGLGDCKVEVWDMEAAARATASCNLGVKTDLSILVPSAQLDALLTKTGAAELQITERDRQFGLKANTTKLAVPKIDETKTSRWIIPDNCSTQIEISKAQLLGSLASSIEDILGTGSQIRGFQLASQNGQICLIATDGIRLYRALIKNDGVLKSEDFDTVLPAKLLKFLKRLDTSKLPLGIGMQGTSYLMRSGYNDLSLEVFGPSVDKRIPETSAIFGLQPNHRYLVSAAKLRAEAELHQTLSTDKAAAGMFEFKEAGLEIETKGSLASNQVNSRIDIGEDYQILERTDDIKIGIRLKYLSEALKFMEVFGGKSGRVEIGIAYGTTGLVWIQPSEDTRKAHESSEIIAILAEVR